MKTPRLPFRMFFMLAVPVLILSGCDRWDDGVDHHPPDGQAALAITNRTAHDLRVYLDGNLLMTAGDWETAIRDLAPGTARLVLDERGGDRYDARDIDLMEGRVTVVEVEESLYNAGRYDIFVHLD
jgi:hypothetical protein